jgi:hypothetical protein
MPGVPCGCPVSRADAQCPVRMPSVMATRRPLDAQSRDLLERRGCGLLNRPLLEGVVVGLGADGVMAVFDPLPDQCCVVIRTFTPTPRGSASAS